MIDERKKQSKGPKMITDPFKEKKIKKKMSDNKLRNIFKFLKI